MLLLTTFAFALQFPEQSIKLVEGLVVVLEKNANFSPTNPANNMWKARQLAQEEFEEHMESVKEHEKYLADFHTLGESVRQDIPPIPVPS